MTDVKMPLTAHLEELRWRLVKAVAAIGVAFAGCYYFAEPLFAFLIHPLMSAGGGPVTLIGTGVVEAFFTKLKVSLIAAIFVASPMLLYQMWAFIAPGLYQHEKRYVVPFVIFGTFFFVAGAGFCYQLVFPVGFAFFIEEYKSIGVEPNLRISEYLSFAARMLLAFGITFEMPVISFFLARMGVITHRTLTGYFRYAVVVIFIAAAVLTPGPDIASQFLMAGPLLLLYILSIGVAYTFSTTGVVAPVEEEVDATSNDDAL
jgi:sec-independent protein translocase protein TatC